MLDIEIKDGDVVTPMSNTDFKDNIFSGASRMRAGQGIYGLRQCILNHFRPLLDIFGAKGLFKDTFFFRVGDVSPLPPLDAPLILIFSRILQLKVSRSATNFMPHLLFLFIFQVS